MNIHWKTEGQEFKTDLVWGQVLVGKQESVREVNMIDVIHVGK
jgi:hypothetical protein